MRALLIAFAALLAASGGAVLGWRLAAHAGRVPQVEAAPPEPLIEPVFARTPVPAEPPPLALEETLEQRGRHEPRWSELNRMAIRALEAGDAQRAVALFEQCVKGVPDEPVFRRNLAEALVRRALRRRERQRPCAPCLEDLERAVELAPEREELALLLERWRAEAEIERDFWRESSQHFDLSYDGERSEILHGSHRLLEELEAAYTDLAELFGRLPVERGSARIRVVLYRRAGFDALTGLGDWAGGAFDGTVRIPVEDLRREERALRSVLRHELVHVFVLACGGPRVPGWLNEGLAQWLEHDRKVDLVRARKTLEDSELLALDDLSGSLALITDPSIVERAYAQSLLLVDWLVSQYGERVPFALVAGCRDGKTPATSFEELTRVPLAAALEDLARTL